MHLYVNCGIITIANIWNQFKFPSVDEWLKKMWYTHTHTHTHRGILLSHKKDEILPFVTTWMDLDGIMLSEISQTDKDKY